MSSTTRKIAPSEWEHHKDTIVELYLTRNKPLKDVRAEMQDQHGFDASSWQYEMQLKRWNVRKNATRREWQQYFAANKDQPIANSRGDVPGTDIAPVILSKSTVSKKRASRWVPGSIVAPKYVPAPHAILAPRVSDSTSLGNVQHPNGVLSLIEPTMAQRNTEPGFQLVFQNMTDSSHATEGFLLLNELCTIDNFSTHSVFGSPSQTFANVLRRPAHSLDFSLTSSAMPGLQSQVYELGDSDLTDFPVMGLPAANNTAIFMLQDIRQILPFAQLEKRILSGEIMLERSAGHTIFGGFAPKVVAGILSSKDQSMVRQTPDLQRFLHLLGAQVPGESSALVTDDQAFETKFARLLLFSMLNGFAGLDGIPMENILSILNQFPVNKPFLDVLEQSPRYVSRTLADNIFRAAIQAKDTKIAKLLLDRRLVDVNETIRSRHPERYTVVQLASELRTLDFIESLIDAVAVDVNESHANFPGGEMSGALIAPISHPTSPKQRLSDTDEWPTIQTESIEALKTLVAADRVYGDDYLRDPSNEIKMLQSLISQNASLESHRDFFQRDEIFISLVTYLDDRCATRLVQHLISLCHQADCNKCLDGLGKALTRDPLGYIVTRLAFNGKLGLVQLLFQEKRMDYKLPYVFLAAIGSKSPAMIDFVLSLGPDLDPPEADYNRTELNYLYKTPLSEAVRSGNEDLVRLLEAKGCLDHLTEGGRFQAVIAAAIEAGNAAYMRKLLTRAVTSKGAFRVAYHHLESALNRNHQDIAQMLLEAGALAPHISLPRGSILEDMQILHALIASGAEGLYGYISLAQQDPSILAVLSNEFPGLQFDTSADLQLLLRKCIDTDTLDLFRAILQTLDLRDLDLRTLKVRTSKVRTLKVRNLEKVLPKDPRTLGLEIGSLDGCLLVAVELGHSNLVEYLLNMGANPFHDSVLRAAISEKPNLLQVLLEKGRRRQTMPKCIGAHILAPLMGNGAGNAEALDELIRTAAINFVRLEKLYSRESARGLREEYHLCSSFTPLGMVIQGVPGRFDSNMIATKKFLEAGADPNGISKSNEEWTKGSPLMTTLMVAIETGLEDAVNMLLDYGADVNARPRIRTTRTALQFAAELGNIDMVRLLLGRGADVNSSASPRGGATALQFAAMTGNCNMVAYLLDHGAQLDALPSRIDGMWPLEGAAANGRLDMVRFLWELNVRAVAGGTFPDGFLERHCLRAMNFAREEGHIGCMYLISDLSGISVDRLETDEYGAPWIAY